MVYQAITIKRNKEEVSFSGNLFLAPSNHNIKPFRMFCKELGSDANSSLPLNSSSKLDFDDENIIAYVDKISKTLITALDKNEQVKIILLNFITNDFDEKSVKEVLKLTKKPIFLEINPDMEIPKIDVTGVCINFHEGDLESHEDPKIVTKFKKVFPYVFIKCKLDTPEEAYSLMKNDAIDAVMIGNLAINRPTIFEQSKNYFEKGYYNKLTRKRREKVVARFKDLYAKYAEKQDSMELNDFNQRFLEN